MTKGITKSNYDQDNVISDNDMTDSKEEKLFNCIIKSKEPKESYLNGIHCKYADFTHSNLQINSFRPCSKFIFHVKKLLNNSMTMGRLPTIIGLL